VSGRRNIPPIEILLIQDRDGFFLARASAKSFTVSDTDDTPIGAVTHALRKLERELDDE
jgi:hypothetical protein